MSHSGSQHYKNRVIDSILARKLEGSGGVIVEGPKACGKTASAMRQSNTVHFVDTDTNFQRLFAVDPTLALHGEPPILLDEWQVEPTLWNHVRRTIDARQSTGQFILSGSAMPSDVEKGHSGLGRFARVRMRPMTGWERGVCEGGLSLKKLLSGETIQPRTFSEISVSDLLEIMCHGGWPADYASSYQAARSHVADYVERLASYDVFDAAGSRVRRPLGVRTLLRSIARNVGQANSVSSLVRDVTAADGTVDRETVVRWIEALQRLFAVESVEAWSPKLRSKATIRTSPVMYLADSSLTAYILGATPKILLGDMETAGFIFENYVYQQLATFTDAIGETGGRVLHYRDSNGKEFDSVLIMEDGSWAGVEVKLGERWIQKGIEGLVAARNSIDTDALGEPAALILIVGGTNLAYTDPETGVHVVPIQALEP